MAMFMPENGAGIRFIQQMFGYADLSAAQIPHPTKLKRSTACHAADNPEE